MEICRNLVESAFFFIRPNISGRFTVIFRFRENALPTGSAPRAAKGKSQPYFWQIRGFPVSLHNSRRVFLRFSVTRPIPLLSSFPAHSSISFYKLIPAATTPLFPTVLPIRYLLIVLEAVYSCRVRKRNASGWNNFSNITFQGKHILQRNCRLRTTEGETRN